MSHKKFRKEIAFLLIIVTFCTSCKLFPTQKMIDNILPDYKKRTYTVADLIPYTYKEIKNAQALYGTELSDFFYKNIATDAVAKRDTKEKQEAFFKELRFRNHNYKTIKKRFSMYVEDEKESQEKKEADRKHEYDEYYKIGNASGGAVLKKYNGGKLSGMPVVSIRAIMSTATTSVTSDIYSEVTCEIYKPVVIDDNDYKKLKIGDQIELTVPVESSKVNKTETKKVICKYIATDSLCYKDENGKDDYYFIADVDGTNTCRRVLDRNGEVLETYVEMKPLQFMKFCRVAEANEPQRLMSAVAQDELEEYDFDKINERALCGGYLVYKYKDFVYGNSITTNLKGYITSCIHYDNQRIDNEFYNSLN